MLSIVTLLESLVEVTAVPALPASSENAIENVIAPSPSLSVPVFVCLYLIDWCVGFSLVYVAFRYVYSYFLFP